VARTWRVRGKKRSGWKHPLDPNRNRRRCDKRRRSASAAARHAVEAILELEARLELIEWRRPYQVAGRPARPGPERRPHRGLDPRRAG
jgi:hypothetical protein